MPTKKLKLEELGRVNIETYKRQDKLPITIVLDNLRSGLNVGAFFRTCDSLGLDSIVLTGICPVPPHKEVHKSAIGSTLSVDYRYYDDISKAISELKQKGYSIIGIEQTTSSVPLHQFEFSETPVAIIFGNEVDGISDQILDQLDATIEIAQYGTKHSLNVAVCGGIVLWEASCQVRQHVANILV